MKTTKILITEDHKLVAEGLKELIEQETNCQVIAIANNGRQAYSYLQSYQPDLLITDLNMPDIDGLELIKNTKHAFPKIKIIVLSMYKSKAIVTKAMATDIDAYLLKQDSGIEVINAIQAVLDGRKYFSNGLDIKSKNKIIFNDDFINKYNLTGREVEILKLIALSNTSKKIAELLSISEFTVQTHRKNLKKKLLAEDTADLVRFALNNGLIKR